MLPHIQSCHDVDGAILDLVFAPSRSASEPTPRERAFSLLQRMAELAHPGDDVGPILDVLARMAGRSWVEGRLAVVIRSTGACSELDVLVYDGLTYTRLISPLQIAVPLDAFILQVACKGSALAPLELAHHLPGEEIELASSEVPPDSVRLLGHLPGEEPVPPSVHRKATKVVPVVKIPPEARRPPEELPPDKRSRED